MNRVLVLKIITHIFVTAHLFQHTVVPLPIYLIMDNCNTPNQGVKVPYDPGWNDPPTFSYNAQQVTPNRPRNFLNKRVAFPLSSSTSSPAPLPPVNLPPISTGTPIAPSLPNISNKSEDNKPIQAIDIDSDNVLREIKTILLDFLEKSEELRPKASGIKRRISVMEEMWANGKLNSSIHLQMKELACALRDDLPAQADEVHRALMVDHVSAVGTWMPAIKQLIHHSIARSELLAIDKE